MRKNPSVFGLRLSTLATALCLLVAASGCDKGKKGDDKKPVSAARADAERDNGFGLTARNAMEIMTLVNDPGVDLTVKAGDAPGVEWFKNLSTSAFAGLVECTEFGKQSAADILNMIRTPAALGMVVIDQHRRLFLKNAEKPVLLPCHVVGRNLWTATDLEQAFYSAMDDKDADNDDFLAAQAIFLALRGLYDEHHPEVISSLFLQNFAFMLQAYHGSGTHTHLFLAAELPKYDNDFNPCVTGGTPKSAMRPELIAQKTKNFTCATLSDKAPSVHTYMPAEGNYFGMRDGIALTLDKKHNDVYGQFAESDDPQISAMTVLTTTRDWGDVAATNPAYPIARFLMGKDPSFDLAKTFTEDPYSEALSKEAPVAGLALTNPGPRLNNRRNAPTRPVLRNGRPTRPLPANPSSATGGNTRNGAAPRPLSGNSPAPRPLPGSGTVSPAQPGNADFARAASSRMDNLATTAGPNAAASIGRVEHVNGTPSFMRDSIQAEQNADRQTLNAMADASAGRPSNLTDRGPEPGQPNIRRFDGQDGSVHFAQTGQNGQVSGLQDWGAPKTTQAANGNTTTSWPMNPGMGGTAYDQQRAIGGNAGGSAVYTDADGRGRQQVASLSQTQTTNAAGATVGRGLELQVPTVQGGTAGVTTGANAASHQFNFTMDNAGHIPTTGTEGATNTTNLRAATAETHQTVAALRSEANGLATSDPTRSQMLHSEANMAHDNMQTVINQVSDPALQRELTQTLDRPNSPTNAVNGTGNGPVPLTGTNAAAGDTRAQGQFNTTTGSAGGSGGSTPTTTGSAGGSGGSTPTTTGSAGSSGGSTPTTTGAAGSGGSTPTTTGSAGSSGGSTPTTGAAGSSGGSPTPPAGSDGSSAALPATTAAANNTQGFTNAAGAVGAAAAVAGATGPTGMSTALAAAMVVNGGTPANTGVVTPPPSTGGAASDGSNPPAETPPAGSGGSTATPPAETPAAGSDGSSAPATPPAETPAAVSDAAPPEAPPAASAPSDTAPAQDNSSTPAPSE